MEILTIPAKNIVFKNKSPDLWFGLDYNMNIYRGCPHGCIYCDSRSDCFNPAAANKNNFDTVKVKENALQIIRDDLRRKVKTSASAYNPVVGTGAMSDPYNPLERKLNLTRNTLELLNAYEFGVSLCTKSALVTRDIDVLTDIKSHSPVIVNISMSTCNDELARKIEPNVSSPLERFETISKLASSGIFCGIFLVPMLPFITDSVEDVLQLLHLAKEAGARYVYTYMGMTLRPGSREYFYSCLDEVLPGIKEKYIKKYGQRYNCISPNSKKLWAAFTTECEKLGLLYDMKAITHHYKSACVLR